MIRYLFVAACCFGAFATAACKAKTSPPADAAVLGLAPLASSRISGKTVKPDIPGKPIERVSIVPPQYYVATADLDGVGTPNTAAFAVAIGQTRTDVDFGLHYNPPPALIGDRVWIDANSNGDQDAGETGMAGVAVTLRDSANAVVATVK